MRAFLDKHTGEILMILMFIVAAVFFFEAYLATYSSVGFFFFVMFYCSLVFSISKESIKWMKK